MSVFAVFYLTVFLLVLFAPREDKLNRGFIPCTKQLAEEIFSCTENKTWCMSKAIVKNTWCDTLVVLDGFGAWVRGRQETPWANYLFTPEPLDAAQNEPDAALTEFYAENPDIAGDMEKLHHDRQKLEQDIKAATEQDLAGKNKAAESLKAEIEALAAGDVKSTENEKESQDE